MMDNDDDEMLDCMFDELVEAVALWRQSRAQLEARLKKGTWGFTTARHHMHTGILDSRCYVNREMEAVRRMEVTKDGELQVCVTAELDNDDNDTSGDGLRKRHSAPVDTDENNNTTSTTKATTTASNQSASVDVSTIIRNDPLKWFGLFLPPSVRESQQHFVQALHEVAKVRRAEANVEAVVNKYEQYLKRKRCDD